MTAALTVLQYGEETKADVEFFTQDDINDIKQISNRYENKLESIKVTEYEKLKKVRLEKEQIDNLLPEQEQEIQDKALKRAQESLKRMMI